MVDKIMRFDDEGWWKKPLATFTSCHHWRQRVQVGRYTLTCSSLSGGTVAPPHPDFGVYLSSLWKEKLGGKIWTNGVALRRAKAASAYPAMIIDWNDMGTVPLDQIEDLVEICLSKMRQGKSIDIACIHGHGRTGTLLACLFARVEHLPAREAIDYARLRYCRHACETLGQDDLINDYVARHLQGRQWRK